MTVIPKNLGDTPISEHNQITGENKLRNIKIFFSDKLFI